MSKAIIQLAGKQFHVGVGDTFVVDKYESEPGKSLTVTDVLMVMDDKKTVVGQPIVAGAKVTLKVTSHDKGDKIKVLKYKSKSRYRRLTGHRQQQTTFEVVSISA